jgi:prophage regulatory protein
MQQDRFIRLPEIIGTKETPGLIPVSRSTWLNGVKTGRYPRPVKLSSMAVAWKLSEVMRLFDAGDLA